MNTQMKRNLGLGILCLVLGGMANDALAAPGACGFVLPKGGSSGKYRCIDNVANADACQRACDRENGISAKFFPGKTCADLEKGNKSSNNVSMQPNINEAVAMVQRTGSAQVAISFSGSDMFTDRSLAGTAVSLQGNGMATLTRGQDGRILVNADNVNIRLTGFRPGEVSPIMAKLMQENFNSARIVANTMRGQIVRVANGYQINMEQERQIQARGISGWISSSGTGFIPIGASSFVYQGTGVTMHSLLMNPGDVEEPGHGNGGGNGNGNGEIENPFPIHIPGVPVPDGLHD